MLFSHESILCSRSQPQRMLLSSRDCGWRSVLLDELEGSGPAEAFDTHPTPDLTLVVATAGTHRLELFRHGGWRSALYQPGACGLNACGTANRLRVSGAEARQVFRTAHLYLPAELVDSTRDEFKRAGVAQSDHCLTALIFKDNAVSHMVAALLRGLRQGAGDLYSEQAARWLAVHLLAYHARVWDPATDHRSPGFLDDRRLARVLDYMSAHIASPLSLGDLAREAGISIHHFGRLFRKRVGVTPHAHLTSLRMESARSLLKTTNLSVGEIAAASGYASAAGFATAFTRRHGQAPRTYRARTQ